MQEVDWLFWCHQNTFSSTFPSMCNSTGDQSEAKYRCKKSIDRTVQRTGHGYPGYGTCAGNSSPHTRVCLCVAIHEMEGTDFPSQIFKGWACKWIDWTLKALDNPSTFPFFHSNGICGRRCLWSGTYLLRKGLWEGETQSVFRTSFHLRSSICQQRSCVWKVLTQTTNKSSTCSLVRPENYLLSNFGQRMSCCTGRFWFHKLTTLVAVAIPFPDKHGAGWQGRYNTVRGNRYVQCIWSICLTLTLVFLQSYARKISLW